MLRKLLFCCLMAVYLCSLGLSALAATPQPVSRAYIERYLTMTAAASCLGVYLPEQSTEFDYLRSFGWQIDSYSLKQGTVETNFAVAKHAAREYGKTIYMVTFRGSASKNDWKLNLKTERVNYGGNKLNEMEQIAAQPLDKMQPAVHSGFNSYVNALLHQAVLDERGAWKGIFREVVSEPDAELVLTGHSLGGAAATLLGERLVSLGFPKEKLQVITFGAPAIGNAVFADTYGESINLLRITNSNDPIPGGLQTFFGGYKQFGEQHKYELSTKISSLQHAMAMYFDYSVSEYYRERDKQVGLDRLQPALDKKLTSGKPVVALWLNTSEELDKLAFVTDIKRFIIDEYRRLLPSYIIMEKQLPKDAYTNTDLVELSRREGADYVLICGIDGSRPQRESYYYLTLEQTLVDAKGGNLLTMGSYGRKVAPAVGNIQAAGESFWQAREELERQLPWLRSE